MDSRVEMPSIWVRILSLLLAVVLAIGGSVLFESAIQSEQVAAHTSMTADAHRYDASAYGAQLARINAPGSGIGGPSWSQPNMHSLQPASRDSANFVAAKSGATGAENAANPARLGKQLASQQQMGEVGQAIAGRGSSTAFRGAARAAEQYGGEASEYSKMTSWVYKGGKGIYDTFETHWIERIPTGERFEFKTKFPLAGD